MKYEYKRFTELKIASNNDWFINIFNREGKEGWILVNYWQIDEAEFEFIFYREVK